MKNHEGNIRRYYISPLDETLYFGLYAPHGGTSGEMSIYWKNLLGDYVPCLHCYDDGWSTLAQFKDVIDAMAEHDNKNISINDFCKMLESCGFVQRS